MPDRSRDLTPVMEIQAVTRRQKEYPLIQPCQSLMPPHRPLDSRQFFRLHAYFGVRHFFPSDGLDDFLQPFRYLVQFPRHEVDKTEKPDHLAVILLDVAPACPQLSDKFQAPDLRILLSHLIFVHGD